MIIDYESRLLTIGMFIGIALASIPWGLYVKSIFAKFKENTEVKNEIH